MLAAAAPATQPRHHRRRAPRPPHRQRLRGRRPTRRSTSRWPACRTRSCGPATAATAGPRPRSPRTPRAIGEAAVALFDGDLPDRPLHVPVHRLGRRRRRARAPRRGGARRCRSARSTDDDLYARFQSLRRPRVPAPVERQAAGPRRARPPRLRAARPTPTRCGSPRAGPPTTTNCCRPAPGCGRRAASSTPCATPSSRSSTRPGVAPPGAAAGVVRGVDQALRPRREHRQRRHRLLRPRRAGRRSSSTCGCAAGDPDGDGLDEVLRLLWKRHAGSADGYTEADVARRDRRGRRGRPGRAAPTHAVGDPGLPDLEDDVRRGGRPAVEGRRRARRSPTSASQPTEDDGGVTVRHRAARPAGVAGRADRAGRAGRDRRAAGSRAGELPGRCAAHDAGDTVEVTRAARPAAADARRSRSVRRGRVAGWSRDERADRRPARARSAAGPVATSPTSDAPRWAVRPARAGAVHRLGRALCTSGRSAPARCRGPPAVSGARGRGGRRRATSPLRPRRPAAGRG